MNGLIQYLLLRTVYTACYSLKIERYEPTILRCKFILINSSLYTSVCRLVTTCSLTPTKSNNFMIVCANFKNNILCIKMGQKESAKGGEKQNLNTEGEENGF